LLSFQGDSNTISRVHDASIMTVSCQQPASGGRAQAQEHIWPELADSIDCSINVIDWL